MFMSEFVAVPNFIFLFFGIFIVGTLFWLWMLIDCAVNETTQGNEKVVWIIIIVFTHLLGAIVYYLVRRPKRKQTLGN